MSSKSRKHNRPATRRAADKTEPKPQTNVEANHAIRETHFCLRLSAQCALIPIAGTPTPRPCPWCGESATVELKNEGTDLEPNWWAFAQCDGCGVKGPEADGSSEGDDDSIHGLCVEAARMWNERKGAQS